MLRTADLWRKRWSVAGVAITAAVVVAGLVGCSSAANHAASEPAQPVSGATPLTSGPASTAPSAQTYPAPGASYVVVPDGAPQQLEWIDLNNGARGHFGPTTGTVSSPSVSADGRMVAYVQQSATAPGTTGTDSTGAIGFWDLDAHRGFTGIGLGKSFSAPAISPDGTRVAWTSDELAIHVLTIKPPLPVPNQRVIGVEATDVTWLGNNMLAYLPVDGGTGGACAVVRLDLVSPDGGRCLLPTATLRSVFAAGGSIWKIDSASGSPDGTLLALGVTTVNRTQHGIALLRTSAEASPFRVLPASIVTESGPYLVLGPPVLISGGSRVLYQQTQGGGNAHVMSIDVATGVRTEITAAFGGDQTLGFGATSG